jgi:peptide/nickel transport system substrate-binding protein
MTRALVLALALTLHLGLTGCGKPERTPGQLVIGRLADPVSLDPAQTVSSGDFAILALAYQTLTRIDPKTAAAVGDLAESWQPASDGMSWTFKLKPGQTFEDGSPVDAEAVRSSFERLRKVSKMAEQTLFWLKGVAVVDASTVRFDLTLPFPPLDRALAVPVAAIVNPKLVAANEKGGDGAAAWMAEHSAGSGRYVVAAWDRGSSVTLKPVPGREAGAFKQIVFRLVGNASSQRSQIDKGDIDVVEQLGAAESQQYAEIKGVTIGEVPSGMALSYLSFNTSRPPFNDLRLRQAVALAIDHQALVKNVLVNRVSPLASPLPPGVPGHDPALGVPQRDVAKARALVAEATGGKGLKANLMVYVPGPVSQLIQANLKDAGIELTLQKTAPAAFDANRASGEFDVIYDSWALDFPDPFIVMNFAFSSKYAAQGPNFSRYKNADVDKLLDAGFSEGDATKRAGLYQQAVRQVMADLPWVMLFSPNLLYAYRPERVKMAVNPFQPYSKTLEPVQP